MEPSLESSDTQVNQQYSYNAGKRLFDFFLAFLASVVLAPVLLGVALAIVVDDRGPIFYRGSRVGQWGRPFHMWKFRTMLVNADKIGGSSTPEDDPRITRVGRVLRKYKLDELPQLFNVLEGSMSFVGPRPQVKWAVDLYSEEERQVLTLKPGISDLASLRFPNEGEILAGSDDPDRDYMELIHPEKMRLSLEYLRRRSFLFDLRIIAETVWTVIVR